MKSNNFNVQIKDGEVYINGEFVAQLCWDEDAVGCAVAEWLKKDAVEEKNVKRKNDIYVMSEIEYNALDKILMASHLIDVFQIVQRQVYDPKKSSSVPCDFIYEEDNGLLSLKEGLKSIEEAMAGDGEIDAMTHYGLTFDEKDAFLRLLEKYELEYHESK